MEETIRRIEEGDFEKVSTLYENRKSVEELKWLYTNPDNLSIYNAFIAINKANELIGVIGYSLSIYKLFNKELSGVIPMTWKLQGDYKGILGVLLFKKVLQQGDFGIAISGSTVAQNLYPMFKYRKISAATIYFKTLDFKKAFWSLKRKNLIKTLRMNFLLAPSYFKLFSKTELYSDLKFISYTGANFVEEKNHAEVFQKKITQNYLDWLLSCPLLDSYGFGIKKGEENIGMCVLYVQRIKNLNIGRVVCIPFLEEDSKMWKSVLYHCIQFFKNKKCVHITGLACHAKNHKVYKEAGFLSVKNQIKPIYIKENIDILEKIDLKNWFIQYSEGDKAYRDF